MPWYKHPAVLLVVFLAISAANAFVIQLALDVQAGRIPVHPGLQPYIPSLVAAAGVVTATLLALLPALWKTIKDAWHLASGSDR